MVIECDKEQILLRELLETKKDIFQVENDIIVNDVKPDVLSIIDTNGILCVNKKEVIEGKVRIEGEINTYITYLADDESGSIRCLNTVFSFSENVKLENYNENMNVKICCTLKNIESKIINGRKINVKAGVEVQMVLYGDAEYNIVSNISNIENIQVLKQNKNIISCIGRGKAKVSAKDTIAISEENDIAEIVNVCFKMINKDVKTSYNKVLVKADADVRVLYMTEEGRINSVNSKIPVMGFIDMPNVDEGCVFNISDQLMNIVIKPNNGDNHNIYIEAESEMQVEVFNEKQIEVVEDLYSTVQDVMPNKRTLSAMMERNNIIEDFKIRESIENSELEDSTIFIDDINVNIIKEDIRMGKVIYEGEVVLKILYIKEDKMDVMTITLPFNYEIISDKINTNSNIIREINVKNENIILQGNRIDVSMDLEFDLIVESNNNLSLIENIEMEENVEKNPYSMIIYFVKPGDTLWKIAKKFKSTVEDIARVNEIENENKIFAGEQLYIPKCVKCNV